MLEAPSFLPMLLSVVWGPVAAMDASLSLMVLFDTVCLQCHDAECSGQLALKRESQGAIGGYVERYAGSRSGTTTNELQNLLVQL
ncbi:MAG TPA: hypothetical protein VD978_33940 [Azospirillum sp.]|nr:hypothetical protein [Azospirillum sp.]